MLFALPLGALKTQVGESELEGPLQTSKCFRNVQEVLMSFQL